MPSSCFCNPPSMTNETHWYFKYSITKISSLKWSGEPLTNLKYKNTWRHYKFESAVQNFPIRHEVKIRFCYILLVFWMKQCYRVGNSVTYLRISWCFNRLMQYISLLVHFFISISLYEHGEVTQYIKLKGSLNKLVAAMSSPIKLQYLKLN